MEKECLMTNLAILVWVELAVRMNSCSSYTSPPSLNFYSTEATTRQVKTENSQVRMKYEQYVAWGVRKTNANWTVFVGRRKPHNSYMQHKKSQLNLN